MFNTLYTSFSAACLTALSTCLATALMFPSTALLQRNFLGTSNTIEPTKVFIVEILAVVTRRLLGIEDFALLRVEVFDGI